MSRAGPKLVTPGNLEDDLGQLAEGDWIVEAVIENLDVKQALYAKLDGVRRPGSIVSSNTSTMPLAQLTEGLPRRLRRDFLITHFFNPPRYMRLLEVVDGPADPAEAVDDRGRVSPIARSARAWSGCKDTPGFIANRIGCYWMQAAFCEAFDAGPAGRGGGPGHGPAARASPRPASSASPTWSASTCCPTSPPACASALGPMTPSTASTASFR